MHFRRPLSQDNCGSRPSDKRGGAGHLDPEIRGSSCPKKFFPALWASVWSKNKRGAAPPGPLPWIRHCRIHNGEVRQPEKEISLVKQNGYVYDSDMYYFVIFFLDLAGHKTNRGHWASYQ